LSPYCNNFESSLWGGILVVRAKSAKNWTLDDTAQKRIKNVK
jgi:hypothetical protein